jgi:hypothetical protein
MSTIDDMKDLIDMIGLDDALEHFIEEANRPPARMPGEDAIDHAHRCCSAALTELESLFSKDIKLTLIARHATKKGRELIVGNDDLAAVRDTLQQHIDKERSDDV